MKTNLALIGFMGAGKTAIGRALAKKMQLGFIDTDSLIVAKAGKSIARIFEEDGEEIFRELELAAVESAAREECKVIACGGGVVLYSINIERLKSSSTIIYLRASEGLILRRLRSSQARPLLNTADKDRQIRRLLEMRKPLYAAAADISINVSESVYSNIERIISKVGKYAGTNA